MTDILLASSSTGKQWGIMMIVWCSGNLLDLCISQCITSTEKTGKETDEVMRKQ
ncbi:MAG: hypothetical protein ACLUR5_04095 [Eubacterium ventriosum]